MNVLTILEVGIGIMFVWFLVSMLVSSIQELIASLLQWRARDLEEEIRQMLEHPERISWPTQVGTTLKGTVGRVRTFFGGPAPLPQAPSQLAPVGAGAGGQVPAQHLEMNVAAGTLPAPNAAASSAGGKAGSFAKGEVSQGSFYRHPLIRDLSLNTGKPKPSYIPTTRFADVLFDLIVDAGAPNSAVLQAAQQAGDLLKDLDAANVQALDADAQRIFLQFRSAVQEVSAWTRNDQRDEGLIQKINVLAGECVKKNENLGFAVRLLQSALQNPPLRQQLASGVVEAHEARR